MAEMVLEWRGMGQGTLAAEKGGECGGSGSLVVKARSLNFVLYEESGK